MKTSYKLLSLLFVSASMAGCADLDTESLGGTVTSEQKQEVLELNPERALAGVTGCFAQFLTDNFDASAEHYDFGYSSLMIGLENQGMDLMSKYIGYNWYNSWQSYVGPNKDGGPTAYTWYTMYDQIGLCNTLISSIAEDTEDAEAQFYRAQGVGLRAFDYWVLAQLYQFNYSVTPNALCVPVITDKNMEEAAIEGMECATVEQVYAQIVADINECVDLLEKSGIDPSRVIDSKPNRLISLATAYALRARVYLTMHEYAKAAADAQKAIANFAGRPYTLDEVSVPTFSSMSDPSWMWGIAVAETDRVVTSGIINFPSHMGSFCYGYVTVGAWRWCNMSLYNAIPKTDVRKGWFLNENLQSPNLNSAQQAYIDGYNYGIPPTDDGTAAIMPFTQVKFAPYKDVLGTSTNACDVPLLRVEEMYLTLAEATGMSQGYAAGKELLESFVKTYRDPAYTCKATSETEFQNECWMQRRIELWGEGLSYFDLMRLNKGVDRRDAYCPPSVEYNIQPQDGVLVYCVPLAEIQTNKKIDESCNVGRGGDRPLPVGQGSNDE